MGGITLVEWLDSYSRLEIEAEVEEVGTCTCYKPIDIEVLMVFF